MDDRFLHYLADTTGSIQAPMDFYDGEGKLLHSLPAIGPSSFKFCNNSSEVVFMINKDGCHVPDGFSADEAAQVVIERLNDHIQNLVKPLEKENAELKANNVELAKALENIIDLAESIRLSGDAGDWCWEEGDEFTTAVQLLRKVKGK